MSYSDLDYSVAIEAYVRAFEHANGKPSPQVWRSGQWIFFDGRNSVRMKSLQQMTERLRERIAPDPATSGEVTKLGGRTK